MDIYKDTDQNINLDFWLNLPHNKHLGKNLCAYNALFPNRKYPVFWIHVARTYIDKYNIKKKGNIIEIVYTCT